MASTYTSNQGLEKPATGDRSGTWGTMTNTNMDMLDRAISGVGALTLTGTTTTLTTSDGSASDGNYKVLVLGGSPSGTNTITLSPNDGDKLYFVVNSTGQSVIFTQGTGANVTIANGAADIIYADGAGGGAAVASVLAKNLVFAGDIDVDGTANLDAVDIDGAVQIDSTVTVGVDDTGYDVKFFGDTASAYMLWDTSTDDLVLAGAAGIDLAGDIDVDGTANLDIVDVDGAANFAADVTFADGADIITATAGTSNVRIGVNAGINIASGGNYNMLIGAEAGNDLTTGDDNTVLGFAAFEAATTNSFNTAIGSRTLKSANKAGDPEVVATSNSAVGYNTLTSLTTGSYNTGCGSQSLQNTTTALSNTVTGYAAMLLNTTGSYNHAYGHAALYNCRTGYGNVAMGYLAAFTVDSGIYNVGVGYQSLYYGTGNYNTGVGSFTLLNTAAGEHNTALGYQAGDVITSGSYNICIGNLTDPSANSSTHQIVIGYNITGGEDNQFTFGKASNVVQNEFDTDANWTRTSDRRKKRNIEDDTLGLEFINNLRTVTHQWKPSNEFPEEWDEYSEENTMNLDAVMHGMIAQEVKEALDKSGCDTFGGWDERSDGSQTVSREMFVIPLIKAVQELSAEVKELKEKLND